MMDLHPKVIDLTLDRVFGLLEALNNPHKKLPAVSYCRTMEGSTINDPFRFGVGRTHIILHHI